MTTITSGKHTFDIEPVKLTIRNYDRLKETADKIKAVSYQDPKERVEQGLALIRQSPQLAELLNSNLDLNSATAAKRTDELGSRDAALESMRSEIMQMAIDSPELARAMFFPEVKLNADVDTLTVCIQAIKDTYNTGTLDKAQMKLVESEITSDFWQDVESEGVLEYALNFCQSIK